MKKVNIIKSSFPLLIINILLVNSVYAITSHSVIKPNTYIPQEQRLIINSQAPQGSPNYSNLGHANSPITCDVNRQLIGVAQSNFLTYPNPPNVGNNRKIQYNGSMLYYPICSDSRITGCYAQTWAKEMYKVDTMQITCAENTFVWRPVGGP